MRLLIAFIMILCLPAVLVAQRPDSMVVVPSSMLTDAQVANLELQTTQAKVAQYGEWVGLGAEIGEAVNGSLAAVTEQTANFARTEVGKITMAVVVWKVIGNDILGIIFTFFLWLTILPIWVWSFKKHALSTTSSFGGYSTNGERSLVIVIHWVILFLMVGMSAMAMF